MDAVEGDNRRSEGPYRFDGVVVDAAAYTLSRDGRLQPVEPKTFAVLLALLRRPGELLSRDELLDAVWGHRHVTPGVLTRAIAQLRHALADDSQHPRYVQTRHALGYRFIGVLEPAADATHEDAAGAGPAPATAPEPEPDVEKHADAKPAVLPQLPPLPAPAPARAASRPATRTRLLSATALLALLALAWAWSQRRSDPAASVGASVAVMPFRNLGDNRDDDYFAEGLAVEMHDALAGVQGLKVAAQMSPASSSNVLADARALGARFGVASVLDASVRREGARVRINARLSDTTTGYTLWSQSYDRELSDVFATQGEIADEVVRSLMGVLPGQREALARRLQPTRNLAAFDDYLRGLQSLRVGADGDRGQRAIGFFNTALAKDAGFARAQAALCRIEARRFEYWHDSEAYSRARRACARAGEMDPGSSDAALAFGNLHRVRREYAQALAQYRRVVDDPALGADGHVGMAKVYAAQGRKALAQQSFRRALALRPGDAATHMEIGFQDYLDGRLGEAIAQYRRALVLDPDDANAWNTLGYFHLLAEEETQAMRAFERSVSIEPNADALGNMGTVKFAAGDYVGATALYRTASELDPDDHVNWGNLGEGLLAGAASPAQVREAFGQADTRVERYLRLNPANGEALAAHGWYRANLGQDESALELARQSTGRPGDPGEIALYNALTFGALGRTQDSLQQLDRARAAGITEKRIAATAVLRREQAPVGASKPKAQ